MNQNKKGRRGTASASTIIGPSVVGSVIGAGSLPAGSMIGQFSPTTVVGSFGNPELSKVVEAVTMDALADSAGAWPPLRPRNVRDVR